MPESNVIGLALVGGLGYLAYKECMLEDSCIGPESCDFPDECYGADNGNGGGGSPPSNGNGGNGGLPECVQPYQKRTSNKPFCCVPGTTNPDGGKTTEAIKGTCYPKRHEEVIYNTNWQGQFGEMPPQDLYLRDDRQAVYVPANSENFYLTWSVGGVPAEPWCDAFLRINEIRPDNSQRLVYEDKFPGDSLQDKPRTMKLPVSDIGTSTNGLIKGYRIVFWLDVSSPPATRPKMPMCGQGRCDSPSDEHCRAPYQILEKVRISPF